MQNHRHRLHRFGLERDLRTEHDDLALRDEEAQFLLHAMPQRGTDPVARRQHIVGSSQGGDAAFDHADEIGKRFGFGEPNDRLDHGKRVLGAMADLAGQQYLAFLGPLAVADVDDRADVAAKDPVVAEVWQQLVEDLPVYAISPKQWILPFGSPMAGDRGQRAPLDAIALVRVYGG